MSKGLLYFLIASIIFAVSSCYLVSILEEKYIDSKTVQKYKEYNDTASILLARQALDNIANQQENIQNMRDICLKDPPPDVANTSTFYKYEYCSNRALEYLGFDKSLTYLQNTASIPIEGKPYVQKPLELFKLTPEKLKPVQEEVKKVQEPLEVPEVNKEAEPTTSQSASEPSASVELKDGTIVSVKVT